MTILAEVQNHWNEFLLKAQEKPGFDAGMAHNFQLLFFKGVASLFCTITARGEGTDEACFVNEMHELHQFLSEFLDPVACNDRRERVERTMQAHHSTELEEILAKLEMLAKAMGEESPTPPLTADKNIH